MSKQLEYDVAAQDKIAQSLAEIGHEIATEKIRFKRKDLVKCHLIKLDDGDMAIRFSITGNIFVTVGDGIVECHRKKWTRSQAGIEAAVAWIDGYIAGYQQ